MDKLENGNLGNNNLGGLIPPFVIESEKGLIGSILLNKDIMLQVGDILLPQHFYDPKHQLIYTVLLNLWEKKQNLDVLVVLDKIKTLTNDSKTNKDLIPSIEEIDKSYLLDLSSYSSLIGNPSEHAELIKEKYILRKLIEISDQTKISAIKQEKEVNTILDEAETKIFNLANANIQQDFVAVSEVLGSTFDRIDDLHQNRGQVRGIPSGYLDLDRMLGGLQPSDLVILAARPSMGKTAFALNLAVNAALKNDIGVGVFSLEMSRDQLTDRMLSNVSDVELYKIRHGLFNDDDKNNDFAKLGRGIATLAEAPIWIDDTGSLNILELRTKCRRLKSRQNIGLIIIDYLQLMSARAGSNNNTFNRVQEVSEISRALKILAKELNVPIVALSQLSRGVETRDDKRPLLSDLRESGSIEQDADVVMFIYRDEVYKKPDPTNQSQVKINPNAEIIIAKHRNGSIGKVELFFRKEKQRFENAIEGKSSFRVPGE